MPHGRKPLAAVAGEDLPEQDRHRPAVDHDVVVGEHEPMPVGLRCGSSATRKAGRVAISHTAARSSPHTRATCCSTPPSSPSRSTYRHGTVGSRSMICTGWSSSGAEAGQQVRMAADDGLHRIPQPVGIEAAR